MTPGPGDRPPGPRARRPAARSGPWTGPVAPGTPEADPATSQGPRPTRRRRPWARQLVQGVLGVALAAGLLTWGLPRFAGTSWHKVFVVLQRIGPGTSIGLMLLMIGGLWLYTFTLTGSLPGLTHARALVLNVCGSSVGNLLPGGGAAGVAATYAICRSWGFSRRDVSTSIIVSGVWNLLARVALPVIGVAALLTGTGHLPRAVVRGAVAGGIAGALLLGLFIAVITSGDAATAVGRGTDKALHPLRRGSTGGGDRSVDELIRDLRARITAVVHTGWLSMTFGLVGYFGVYYVLFWACLHAVGVHVSPAHLFAAYAVGRLLTAVGVTPGGVGITESGTAAVLIALGADHTAAAAGVILFSIYTHLLEIPLGALGWVAWGLTSRTSAKGPTATSPAAAATSWGDAATPAAGRSPQPTRRRT